MIKKYLPFVFLLLLVGCHDEQPYLEEYFLIDEIQNVSEKEIIVSGRALSVNTTAWRSPGMFYLYIPIVDKFVNYLDKKREKTILKYTSDKYYASSCKKQDGMDNTFSKYPTAVIYWPDKSKLYFVAFSSFGI